MIFKVQRPIKALSSPDAVDALVYNQSRSIEFSMPIESIKYLFPNNDKITSYKVYVEASAVMTKEGYRLSIQGNVAEQDW